MANAHQLIGSGFTNFDTILPNHSLQKPEREMPIIDFNPTKTNHVTRRGVFLENPVNLLEYWNKSTKNQIGFSMQEQNMQC